MKTTRTSTVIISILFALFFPPLWVFFGNEIMTKILHIFFSQSFSETVSLILIPASISLVIPLSIYWKDELNEQQVKIKNSLISFLIIVIIGGVSYIMEILYAFSKALSGISN